MYYLRSRYYDPEWGRFLNADTFLGRIGGQLRHNLFAYCSNAPVGFLDNSGHEQIIRLPEGPPKLLHEYTKMFDEAGYSIPKDYDKFEVFTYEGLYYQHTVFVFTVQTYKPNIWGGTFLETTTYKYDIQRKEDLSAGDVYDRFFGWVGDFFDAGGEASRFIDPVFIPYIGTVDVGGIFELLGNAFSTFDKFIDSTLKKSDLSKTKYVMYKAIVSVFDGFITKWTNIKPSEKKK